MTGLNRISMDTFLACSRVEIASLVQKLNYPVVGIFVADGNRRLVMAQTGTDAGSNDFYDAYLKITTGLFKKNLTVFFEHGLKTLIFPLFGPSLLNRDDKYCHHVMPKLVEMLFGSQEWLSFYRHYGIGVKVYGNLRSLEQNFKSDHLKEMIKQAELQTSSQSKHRLYFGFFSDNYIDEEMIEKIVKFYHQYNRKPHRNECIKLYYGEDMPSADFFINSVSIGSLGALPPLICGKETHMYTLMAPGVFALNEKNYRKILYDLIFCKTKKYKFIAEDSDIANRQELDDYYKKNQSRVLGTGKMLGHWRVLNDEFK